MKCDPWSLFCFPRFGGAKDLFAPAHSLGLDNQSAYGIGIGSSHGIEIDDSQSANGIGVDNSSQQTLGGRTYQLNKACGLSPPMDATFGVGSIYPHRCTMCHSEAYGR